MLRCINCGHIFDEDEADTARCCVAEFWGQPAYETYKDCPECHAEDITDFEYPLEGCENYGQCDFDCENCEYADQKEAEDGKQE